MFTKFQGTRQFPVSYMMQFGWFIIYRAGEFIPYNFAI